MAYYMFIIIIMSFFFVAFMAYSPSFYFYFHGMINYFFILCLTYSLDKYKNLPILQHLASFTPTILSGRSIYY